MQKMHSYLKRKQQFPVDNDLSFFLLRMHNGQNYRVEILSWCENIFQYFSPPKTPAKTQKNSSRNFKIKHRNFNTLYFI